MSAFHSGKSPWAKIKHSILGTYLPLFIGKTRLFEKHVYLVDGFAGQGKYDDGEAGSALISAEIARSPNTASNQGVFRCINVEKDSVFFSKLEEATKEHTKLGLVRNTKGDFEKKLPEILQSIHGETALFFIDPFGTEGATANTLALIADREGVTEALIRFDDTRVKRLINFNKNDLAGENIKAVKTAERFLERARKLTSEEGVKASLFKDPNAGRIIVEEYIKLVVRDLKLFRFGLAYPIVNPATLGHRYYLAHFCNHADGYTYMANFMAKVQRTVEKVTAPKQELEMFGSSDAEAELMNFREELVKAHEATKVNAIIRHLPAILKEKGLYGQTVERREVYAAIVDHFGWTVLMKEYKRALQIACTAGLLSFEKEHDAAKVTINQPHHEYPN